jgi:hypothetical protein
MKTTARSFFALVTVAALALSGCTGAGGAPEDDVVTSGEGGAAEPVVDVATVAALTGEEIEAGSLSRPSFAAKIDNHPMARPQVGLDDADIVFEELVEGGLTRYLAVWHSVLPAEIGPVRSVRPMDADIVSPFGGLFAYFGGQIRFIEKMRATPVENIILGQKGTEDLYYRSDAKVAPHNVLVALPELVDQYLDIPAPAQQFAYAASLPESTAVTAGTPVESVGTRFSGLSSPSWVWDVTQSNFLRFQTNGLVDVAGNGNQISATNLIVLLVGIDVVEDIPTTRLVTQSNGPQQGSGWVATGGSIVEVTWSKASPVAPIVLTTADGSEVRLGAGKTWVELVPNDSSDVSAGVVTIK